MPTMAQVTVYLPEKTASEARRQAAQLKKSLSAYVAGLIEQDTVRSEWPAGFVELLTRGGGDLVVPADPPPEDVEGLG